MLEAPGSGLGCFHFIVLYPYIIYVAVMLVSATALVLVWYRNRTLIFAGLLGADAGDGGAVVERTENNQGAFASLFRGGATGVVFSLLGSSLL